jgi:hypothetical protein
LLDVLGWDEVAGLPGEVSASCAQVIPIQPWLPHTEPFVSNHRREVVDETAWVDAGCRSTITYGLTRIGIEW